MAALSSGVFLSCFALATGFCFAQAAGTPPHEESAGKTATPPASAQPTVPSDSTQPEKATATTPARKGPKLAAPTLGRDPSAEAPVRRPIAVYRPSVPVSAAGKAKRNARYRDPKVAPKTKVPGAYPWHFDITATVFWIGELPTARNRVPNDRSSWDTAWMENFGGFDTPDPTRRTADYCPKGFRPRLNPFYIALPYNDCVGSNAHKPEAARVIPWFKKEFRSPGASVCKGKWVQIFYEGNYCFAQWEDCGPFTTEDWPYVFGGKAPRNRSNKGAGIDISPAVRDYLGIEGGTASVHWRFVEFYRVPLGPWAKYGENNPFVNPAARPKSSRKSSKTTKSSPKRPITHRDTHGP